MLLTNTILGSTPGNIILAVAFCILSYLIGSIPHGVIIGKKFANIDVREHGSKNIGATNSIRVLGAKLGYTVFALDCLKGAVVIIIAKYVLAGVFFSPIPFIIYGVFAVLGHVFPIYIGFKGGKAVATSLGCLLAIAPLPALLCLVTFWLVIWLIGYVSIASCSAALTALIVAIIMHFTYNADVAILNQTEPFTLLFLVIIVFMIFYRHKSNFIKLYHHKENNVHERVNRRNRKLVELKEAKEKNN